MFNIIKHTNKKVKHFFMTLLKRLPDIKKVAKIARISITETEAIQYQDNLDSILPWFHAMLSTEITDEIKSVYSLTSLTEGVNQFNDEADKIDSTPDVMHNVPSGSQNLITVPKVI